MTIEYALLPTKAGTQHRQEFSPRPPNFRSEPQISNTILDQGRTLNLMVTKGSAVAIPQLRSPFILIKNAPNVVMDYHVAMPTAICN